MESKGRTVRIERANLSENCWEDVEYELDADTMDELRNAWEGRDWFTSKVVIELDYRYRLTMAE